jgi:hypothetical protein
MNTLSLEAAGILDEGDGITSNLTCQRHPSGAQPRRGKDSMICAKGNPWVAALRFPGTIYPTVQNRNIQLADGPFVAITA